MQCDRCGEDRSIWGELQSITRIDNSKIFHSIFIPQRPEKELVCWECLGWENPNKEGQVENSFIPIETRQAIMAKYLPSTNTKPSRYSLKYGNEKCIKSIHIVEDVPCQYVAQVLAQIWMKELELKWEIKSAAILADGTYVFVG
jgi:hypothetical protein